MLHDLTITVDDSVYQTLKPMVEQQTISTFLHEFLQTRAKSGGNEQQAFGSQTPAIAALRGTLHRVDLSDLREETDRPL